MIVKHNQRPRRCRVFVAPRIKREIVGNNGWISDQMKCELVFGDHVL